MSEQNNHICQNCGQNPSELSITFRHSDQEWDLHLCGECASAIRRYTGAAMMELQRKMAGAARTGSFSQAGQAGSAMEPVATGAPTPQELEGFRLRRKVNQLQACLEEAVAGERYEDAARLRDKINEMEKGGVPL